jgi:cytochrome c oxidase cbb3-type subunit IV
MNFAIFHMWWTVALVILFVGIIVWAWSGRRKQRFDAAARMPLEDEDSPSLPLPPGGRGEEKRGKTAPNAGRGRKHG